MPWLPVAGEPLPVRHTPSRTPDPSTVLDPIQLARTYEQSLAAAQTASPGVPARGGVAAPARAVPPPVYSAEIQSRGGEALYSGDRLPGAGELIGPHAQSGQWIGHP